jgi:hypothetical protein
MVGATAFIAGSRARSTETSSRNKASIESTPSTSDAAASPWDGPWANWVRARACNMSNLPAGIAASASASAAKAKGRAIRLHVT